MTNTESRSPAQHSIVAVNDSGLTVGWIGGRVKFPQFSQTIIAKATCNLHPNEAATLDTETPWPLSGDQHHDDDPEASLRYESDFVYFKPAADLLLSGTCHVPEGKAAQSCPVSFSVGDWSRTLHVIGQRFWNSRDRNAKMTEPMPFKQGPIRYEYAFGGSSYELNPMGKGIDPMTLEGRDRIPLPNIEAPESMITGIDQRPPPAGFGPFCRTWKPRAQKCGTYDELWLEKRWPWLAEDLDWSFYNAAPPEQQLPGYLKGDESLVFKNLHPEHSIYKSQLPGLRIRAFVQRNHHEVHDRPSFEEVTMNLDTLWVDMEDEKLVLVWRGVTETCSEFAEDIASIYLMAESMDSRPATLSEAQNLMAKTLRSAVEPLPPPELPDINAEIAEAEAEMDRAIAEAEDMNSHHDPEIDQMSPEDTGRAMFRSQLERMGENPTQADDRRPSTTKETQEMLDELGIDIDLSEFEFNEDSEAAPLDRETCLEMIARGESLRGRDLSQIDLSECDLSGIDFSQTILTSANFRGAKLVKAKFEQANLANVQLVMADLRKTDFYQADLDSARMMNADLSGCRLENASLANAILHSAKLHDANARSSDFSNADLRHSDFSGSDLELSDFSDCQLDGAIFRGVTAPGVNFERITGESADFSHSRLEGANFSEGCHFSGCLFVRIKGNETIWDTAILESCDFRGSSLRMASFEATDLRKANFLHCDLAQARFLAANLTESVLNRANLFQSSLEKADLTSADLSNTNLYEAETRDALLQDTRLENADLKMTKLANIYR